MGRKVGPLPMWAWIAMAAAVGAVVYIRARASGGTQAPPAPADPAANDQLGTTGLVSNLPLTYFVQMPPPAPAGRPRSTGWSTVDADGHSDPGPGGWAPGFLGLLPPGQPPGKTFGGMPGGVPGPSRPPASPTYVFGQPVYPSGDGVGSGFSNTPSAPARGLGALVARVANVDAPPAVAVSASVPSVPVYQRQPAHPHEQVHAPAPTHHAAPPASTRFSVGGARAAAPESPDAPHAPGAIPYPIGAPA